MLIEKLDQPVNTVAGEPATHSVTSSFNGMVTTRYVDAQTANLLHRAMEIGRRHAYADIRELLKLLF